MKAPNTKKIITAVRALRIYLDKSEDEEDVRSADEITERIAEGDKKLFSESDARKKLKGQM